MKNLQINEDKALKLYPFASAEFKQMLDDSFGKEFFAQKITDRVKTFEDACNIAGPLSDNISLLLKYNGIDKDMLAVQALAKLSIIARVLNEGWTPDWNNGVQPKWYPYFKAAASGFGFSAADFVRWSTNTDCGSRLCFKSSELAEYAGKQFISIYNDLLT
jgi:hypothetical protein